MNPKEMSDLRGLVREEVARQLRESREAERRHAGLPTDRWQGERLAPAGCAVCGITWEAGKAYGYCCMNAQCPSRPWS